MYRLDVNYCDKYLGYSMKFIIIFFHNYSRNKRKKLNILLKFEYVGDLHLIHLRKLSLLIIVKYY